MSNGNRFIFFGSIVNKVAARICLRFAMYYDHKELRLQFTNSSIRVKQSSFNFVMHNLSWKEMIKYSNYHSVGGKSLNGGNETENRLQTIDNNCYLA